MMTELIESGSLPSAVFAASDPIALGALNAAKEQGLKVPGDLSFIGFDDISLCRMASPPLTTVHAPAYEMGRYGAGIVYSGKPSIVRITRDIFGGEIVSKE